MKGARRILQLNKPLKDIIDKIDKGFKFVEINFENESWRDKIPPKPGWYLIKTNTPINVLRMGQRPEENTSHIDIAGTIENVLGLKNLGIIIMQDKRDKEYVVYNGEAKNLQTRAREHVSGHKKTYCLGLKNYECFRNYKWTFYYVDTSCLENTPVNKILSLAVEQGWRARNGWPILCRK